jgi:hypothetical protein
MKVAILDILPPVYPHSLHSIIRIVQQQMLPYSMNTRQLFLKLRKRTKLRTWYKKFTTQNRGP